MTDLEDSVKDIPEEKSFEVEEILDIKLEKGHTKYLMKWLGYVDPTWEPRENLTDCADLLFEFHEYAKPDVLNVENLQCQKPPYSVIKRCTKLNLRRRMSPGSAKMMNDVLSKWSVQMREGL